MTLKDKKNKREYNRKLKAEGGAQSSSNDGKGKKKEKPSFTGVTETADKLISDANKRFEQAELQQVAS